MMDGVQLELVPRPASALPERSPSAAHQVIDAFVLSAIDNHNTRRSYRAHLRKAFDTISVRNLRDLNLAHLAAIRAAIMAAPLASASQAQAISALRAFLAWVSFEQGSLSFSLESARHILRVPSVQTIRTPAILTEDEAGRAIDKADPATGTRAMVQVLLGAGLRVAELCVLDCEDLLGSSQGFAMLKIHGKGNKQRLVPIHPPLVDAIRDYLLATGRTVDSHGPLFLSHDPGASERLSRRLTTGSARRRVNSILRNAGITKPVRVHGLRHSYAVAVFAHGHDLNALRALLGHASVATTQTYIDHLQLSDLLKVVPPSLASVPPQRLP
jgi:site-specific recombinase XerD